MTFNARNEGLSKPVNRLCGKYLYQYKRSQDGPAYISTYFSETPYTLEVMNKEIQSWCVRKGFIFIGII